MLEQPDIADQQIVQCLHNAFGIAITKITFLRLGADVNTAVYRAIAEDQRAYFVKLRRNFEPTSVQLPKYLSDLGIPQIIAPSRTQAGQLWANLDTFTLIVYPFVEGQDGYQLALSKQQWHQFGKALKRIHCAAVPQAFGLEQESYSDHWREQVRTFLKRFKAEDFHDPISAELADLLIKKGAVVVAVVERAEELARVLQKQATEWSICHSDVHAGNVLIAKGGDFYIVDWDTPILAPKERDLMFIGGGQGFVGHTAEAQEDLFYQGYGSTEVDAVALTYYRYERIVQDIAAFCQEILSTAKGQDRAQALRYLAANFTPGSTLEMAYRSDKSQG